MLKKKAANKKKQSLKATIAKEVTLLLSAAVAMLKEKLGEKKFEKRIKKAAKLLVSGIKPVPAKKRVIKKKPLKKAVKKAVIPAPVKKAGKTKVKK